MAVWGTLQRLGFCFLIIQSLNVEDLWKVAVDIGEGYSLVSSALS